MSRQAEIAALPDWLAPRVQNNGAPAGRSAVARSHRRDSPAAQSRPRAAAWDSLVMPAAPRRG